jgi:murein DD-endopeptidase MepM/ murein hydrolase activator NlpD
MLKRGLVALIGIFLIAIFVFPQIANAQPSIQPSRQQTVTVRIEPSLEIQQGRTALIRVSGLNISRVEVTFLGQFVTLHQTSMGDWMGFLAVTMDTAQGIQQANIYTWFGDDPNNQRTIQDINVLWGGFPSEQIGISYALSDLLSPELNQWELDFFTQIYNRVSPERFFTTFVHPVEGPVISTFGNFRDYNNSQLKGRHTGQDYRVNGDTPIGATANGRVIIARNFPIRGNHVVIDHGWGVLSGYSHMNTINVVPGQIVRQGEIIGTVGSTGRSQGPHFHFEISVNGYWVDPNQFLLLNIPTTTSQTQ